MTENLKSDVSAKEAFRDELLRRGFDTATITAAPADITATKAGERHFFELKFTKSNGRYFGAATLTEWEAALQYETRYRFVVAFVRGAKWVFHEYTPAEFMQMSYIPPFKIFFNVAVAGEKLVRSREGSVSVSLTTSRIAAMSEMFRRFRSGEVP